MNDLRRGRLLILAAGVCMSTAGACVKLAKPLNGLQIAGVRSLIGIIFLVLVTRFWRSRPFLPGVKVLLLACCYAGMLIPFVMANTLTTAANATFLQSTAPLWVILLAPWLLQEPFRMRDLVVLLVCAFGMALFFMGNLSLNESKGNLLALVSGAGYGAVCLGLRWGRHKKPQAGATTTAPAAITRVAPSDEAVVSGAHCERPPSDSEAMVVWGNLCCFLVCIALMDPLPPLASVPVPMALAAGMGIFQLGLGYLLLMKGFTHVPAAQASLFGLSEPILSPFWAFIFAHEAPGGWALVGGSIVVVTLAIHALSGDSAAKESPQTAELVGQPISGQGMDLSSGGS